MVKVWADKLRWGVDRTVSKEGFCWAMFIEVEEGLINPLYRVEQVLYPKAHVVYYLPVGYNLPIGNLTRCHTAGRVQHRIIQGRCIHFGDRGHIGLNSSNQCRIIPDMFQTEANDKDMGKTF